MRVITSGIGETNFAAQESAQTKYWTISIYSLNNFLQFSLNHSFSFKY